MAYIGNSPYQGSITGGNIVDGSIESIDLATLTNIDINSGSIDGTIIGASSAAAGSFTTLNTTSSVGIGTSSPTQKLHLSSTGNTFARIDGGAASTTGVLFDAGDGAVYYDASSNFMRFDTLGTEAARIDSSGNLLVGKTSADFGASAGAEIRADGRVAAGRAGETLVLNRLTSDGDIALFRKDGTTVGSIGCNGAAIHMASGTTGLRIISDNTIRPSDASGNAKDATIDLGASGSRFKDLYLSGGVYLGGTGAANYLDDYESGTFTPAWNGGTLLSSNGTYTKIGNLVTVFLTVEFGTPSNSDTLYLTLPFTASNAISAAGAVMGNGINLSDSNIGTMACYTQGINRIYVYQTIDTAGWNVISNDAVSSGDDFILTITYQV